MSPPSDSKRQFHGRAWPLVLDALPSVRGATVLDLGCGVGDQAAELVARGARVIAVDMNAKLVHEARARGLAGAEFRLADLRAPLDLGVALDGIWGSYTAAYFTDLPAAIAAWGKSLRSGGWIALTEIDDFFGHEPLGARTRSLLESYARDALAAGRYDFHMGRKLRDALERSGFSVTKEWTLADQELSFDGPALRAVVDAWRARLDRMKLLRDHCGPDFEHVRKEFLDCLMDVEHRSVAKVYGCIAVK